ncbi:VWA domain-containing protein [Salicibibacter halophilus]|uniref:VWA domain-containing protein n=1 Tax=Salicibibacter halophilus TaxID=2502791 RepID=A0A514LHI4_9BACI|nr:VWA domain-containing protein [Salicibibacter halophilus]QDI90751.1 VWA domain-containing protein [Salicibibacter halophilus]
MKRRLSYCLMYSLFLLLFACGSDENEAPVSGESEEKEETSAEEAAPEVELDQEAILQAGPGFLTEEYLSQEYEMDDYDEVEERIMEDFEPYATEHAEASSPEEWLAVMVHALGADHQEVFEPIEAFDVTYDEFTLPDGRSLQELEDEEIEEEMEKDVNVAILVDASGSMNEEVDGGVKMDLAKDAVQSFVGNLPEETNVMLQAYGHEGDNTNDGKEESCASIENVYPLSPLDEDDFDEALESFDATGWTPLAAAITQAGDDLQEETNENDDHFIYVISDGIETCDGDPIDAAENLENTGIDFNVHILGFDIPDDEHDQLEDIAGVTDGEYSSVYTEQELDETVNETWTDAIGTSQWLLWAAGNITDSNFESVDFHAELRDLRSDATQLRRQENSRMQTATSLLAEAELINDEERDELETLVDERHEYINEFVDDSYDDTHQEIIDERERVQDIIRDIRDEYSDWDPRFREGNIQVISFGWYGHAVQGMNAFE